MTITRNVNSNVHRLEDVTRLSASLFSPHSSKLCSRETNCHVALALQWRMKVHGPRQTSIPLQPPLSNKHIYYSDRARLEVSPHTPPTGCNPGQWDSGCSTLGISTGTRKKENKWSTHFFSPRRGIKGHCHCLHTPRKSLFTHWCFMIFLNFFFCSPAGTINGPFPPSFFTIQMSMTSLPQSWSAQFIGSTVS